MTTLPEWVEDTLGRIDEVHAVFDQQDSGNLGFGLTQGRHRWFVKVATTARAAEGLRRAAVLHNNVQHPAIVEVERVLLSTWGSALVFPWVDGRSLYAPANKRGRRRSAPGRFRELPVERVLAALDAIFDAHCAIEAAGFVSSDFYDGCLIYDFDAHRMHLIDLDEYRPGPFVLEEGLTKQLDSQIEVLLSQIGGRAGSHHRLVVQKLLDLAEVPQSPVHRTHGGQHVRTLRIGLESMLPGHQGPVLAIEPVQVQVSQAPIEIGALNCVAGLDGQLLENVGQILPFVPLGIDVLQSLQGNPVLRLEMPDLLVGRQGLV